MYWETIIDTDDRLVRKYQNYIICASLLDESWHDRTLQQWEITVQNGDDTVYTKILEVRDRESIQTILKNVSQQYPD